MLTTWNVDNMKNMPRIRNQDDERKAQHYASIILELEYCPVHLLRVQAFPCAHPNQWETQPEPDWLLSMLPWDTLETQEVTLTYSHCRNNFHWLPSLCKRAFWSFECFWVLARCFLASYHVKSSCNFDHQLCLDAAMAEQNQGTSGACRPLSWSVLEPGVHVMLQPWAKVNQHATSNFEPLPCREALELSPGQSFENKRLWWQQQSTTQNHL